MAKKAKKVNMNRKMSQVKTYRRKKDLCEDCGRFEPDEMHECLINYVKADMRGQDLLVDDISDKVMKNAILTDDTPKVNEVVSEIVEEADKEETTDEVKTETLEDVPQEDEYIETPSNAFPELDASIKTILSYRKRKGLCAFCGKDPHDNECVEDYTASDLRSEEEKEADPRTVVTPKVQETTALEDIINDEVNKDFMESTDNQYYKINKTVDIYTQRPYYVLDITPSDSGQKFSFEYLNYMARKHKNMIMFLIGDPTKAFTFLENRTLEGLKNVSLIRDTRDQNIINYLHAAQRVFGFPNNNITYCMCWNIKCTTFFDNTEKYDLPCEIVNIPSNDDVTLETIKTNVLSWRI